jgi:hypothetical protein
LAASKAALLVVAMAEYSVAKLAAATAEKSDAQGVARKVATTAGLSVAS